jgi:hypothetical protein
MGTIKGLGEISEENPCAQASKGLLPNMMQKHFP